MRFKVLLILVIISSISFGQDNFFIKGKIKKSKTKKIWIHNFDYSISDTVKLNFFRKFKYATELNKKEIFYIRPLESENTIVLQPDSGSTITICSKSPYLDSADYEIKGSLVSVEANQFIDEMNLLGSKMKATEEKLYQDETAEGQFYYDSILQKLSAQSKELVEQFVDQNGSNSVLVTALNYVDYNTDYLVLKKLEKGMQDGFDSTQAYQRVKTAIFKYEMAQQTVSEIGEEAPVLVLPGIDGKDVSMQKLLGNYIIIDFWASWCKPCRAEHPRLTKLYHQYKNKGLSIYSVSLDRSKEKWIQAIQEDGLVWKDHVSNLRMFESPAVKIYGINSIPSNVLIDKNGKVIAFNLRGDNLENKLNQLFNETNGK